MAFNIANLAVVAQNGTDLPRIFIYKTTDALADVNTSGYFDSASKILKVLDVIKLFTSVAGTPVVSEAYVVSNASGVVDITDSAVLAATDTD
jgi:hypothetical protein